MPLVNLNKTLEQQEQFLSSLPLPELHQISVAYGWDGLSFRDLDQMISPLALGVFEYAGQRFHVNPGFFDLSIHEGWHLEDDVVEWQEDDLEVMDNGWTRLWVTDVDVLEDSLEDDYYPYNQLKIATTTFNLSGLSSSWIAQAHHIEDTFGTSESLLESSLICDSIHYHVKLEWSGKPWHREQREASTLDVYLFICPIEDLQDHERGFPYVGIPECPGYWSFDPTGAQKIAPGSHGLPEIRILCSEILVRFPQDLYDAVADLHASREFNPKTLDVTHDVGYPLYELLDGDQDHCSDSPVNGTVELIA
ncbi:hypothetical protein C8R44DRAFT_871837 [Mycena epipterygia]|nr:hypothetical protein C8R44DRAFT_871837 [Mycena epipterygia]